jgi:hypothetical protein
MKTSTHLPVLRTGKAAYYDGLVGIIPCKIDSISSEHPEDMRPGSNQHVTATITETVGAFHKGQTLTGWGLHFFPRAALGHGQHTLYIKPYQVQA